MCDPRGDTVKVDATTTHSAGMVVARTIASPCRADPHRDHTPLLDIMYRPGLRRLFVHDYLNVGAPSLAAMLGAVRDDYAERALVLARAGDLVVVPAPVDPEYLAYLHTNGMGTTTEHVLALPRADGLSMTETLARDESALAWLADRVSRDGELAVSSYIADRCANELVDRLRRTLPCGVNLEGGAADASRLANQKDVIRAAAAALGVPIAPGEAVQRSEAPSAAAFTDAVIAAAARQVRGAGALIRGCWALAGSDTYVATAPLDQPTLRRWLEARPHQDAYLVEQLLPVVASPNVQLWVERDATVHINLTSNQRLTPGLAHVGNCYPHQTRFAAELRSAATAMGRWLADRGFRGPLGMDFLETIDPITARPALLLAEVNARFNAASYAAGAWEAVNRRRQRAGQPVLPVWISNKRLPTRHRSFQALARALGDLLYADGSSGGAIPYHTAMLLHGNVTIVILGQNSAHAAAIEAAIMGRL